MLSPVGRPKIENPKNVRLEIRLTKEQSEKITECAKKLKMTKTDVLLLGIDKVREEIKK